MATQILPQAIVYQQYDQVAASITEPLRAFIVGPDFHVEDYTSTNKTNVAIGQYDGTALTAGFPNRDAGDVVKTDYTKVFLEAAALEYYVYVPGSTEWTATSSKITAANVILTDDNGKTRDAALARNVKAGDLVEVTYGANTHRTTVIGLEAVIDPASVATPATPDISNSNSTLASSSSVTWLVANTPAFVGTVSATGYDGLATGDVTDVYTLEILTGGVATTSGSPVTARITSQSGNDPATVVTILRDGVTWLTQAIPLGTRGATLVLNGTAVTSLDFDVGTKLYATVVMNYTKNTTAVAAAGTYTGSRNATYEVEIVTGGVVGTDTITFKVRALNGIVDVGGPYSATTASPISVGSKGITVAFTNAAQIVGGEKYSFAATAAAPGEVRKILVADPVPSTITAGADIGVKIFSVQNLELPATRNISFANWTQAATTLTVNTGITIDDEVLGAVALDSATVYVQWKGYRTANTTAINSISNVSELGTYFKDNTGPESFLAYGIKKALANSNGTDVRFIAVASDAEASWVAALDKSLEVDYVYGLAPLTTDPVIKDLVAAHVASQSSPEQGRWRVVWFGADNYTESRLVGDTEVTGTVIDDPDTAGTQYTLVTAALGGFIDAGVRSGDTLRISYTVDASGTEVYSSYVIDTVVNNTTIKLLAGPVAAISVAERIEVWRTLTASDIVSLAILDNTYASKLVRNVLAPDLVASDGAVHAMYLAAAYAGLRSGVAPHQGLTNVQIAGFASVGTSSKFSRSQLDQLANAGYFIVTQDVNTGVLYSRKQITTDVTSVDTVEDSVVATDHAISYAYAKVIGAYIGNSNVTASNIELIKADLDAVTAFLKTSGYTAKLGGMVIDANIRELRPHAVFPDRLVAIMDVTRPAPLNNLELYLVLGFFQG